MLCLLYLGLFCLITYVVTDCVIFSTGCQNNRRYTFNRSRYVTCNGVKNKQDNNIFPETIGLRLRKSLSSVLTASTLSILGFTTVKSILYQSILTIPLTSFDGVLCMNYTIDGEVFRGIVDTGSPFLIVPSVCTSLWGCRAKKSLPHKQSSYSDTIEIYGGQDYSAEWKIGDLSFGKSIQIFKNIVFAEVGSDVMLPPGGVFIGLVKYKGFSTEGNSIRPTLLEQMDYNSFQLDVPNKLLKLSKTSLLNNNNKNTIKMVDLRTLGDSVFHYAVPVKKLEINGKQIGEDVDIYAIFDSGTSGCVLSDDLFNDENTPLPIRKVTVTLISEDLKYLTYERFATRKNVFVVTAAKIPWFNNNNNNNDNNNNYKKKPEIIVLGMAFMINKVLTVDIENEKLSLENI